ncbi:hypothetical protein [Paenibacillus macquariensis]|uniref:Uncharacterized protein n=1 Tax=Paenibacillus macquariensis TaxID=948756 RepID=A0ABY1KD54_9BACL|nr:hypothetical protein [Paenibacillus macquariensis]MEC0093216.1 hypothetical protein [Paenibacillus macquariensis]OAB35041.1 hypothetical protein PMSM_10665 [Paenibacillus macquariensis subsp. macquariensis]SIR62894.1 hypothetical protein SAMN05421578_12445 [Paenibacillus macquariensis]
MEIDYIKYLPVIAAILSVVLGFMFGTRTKKNDRLMQYTEENLEKLFSPMYHEMLKIISCEKPKEREELIDVFFVKYLASDTPIYKIGSLELLDTFYELNDSYNKFKRERDEEIWDEFFYNFECVIFYKVNEGYRNSTNLLYRDFNWHQYIQTKPYWMKFYFESMKFLYETIKGVTVISLLLFYFSGCFSLFKIGLFPKDFWLLSLAFLGLSALTMLILLVPNAQYISLTSNSKQSFTRKVMRKHFPKLRANWDGLFRVKKDYDKVPKMYKKQLFKDESVRDDNE